MSHYFESPAEPLDEARLREVDCEIWDETLTFRTAAGVFSGTRLDPGTGVLFKESSPPTHARRVADVGCGFGPIAIALARRSPGAIVDAIDVNDRALQLTRLNADALGVGARVHTLRPDEADPATRYDQLWSNPPIRIGKSALHELLLTWLPRLADDGEARLVVGKNLGADSLQRWIAEQVVDGRGFTCERAASAKGFRVLSVRPTTR